MSDLVMYLAAAACSVLLCIVILGIVGRLVDDEEDQ